MKKFRRFISNDASWNPLDIVEKFQLPRNQRNRIWLAQVLKLQPESCFTTTLNSSYTEDRDNGPHGLSVQKYREISLLRRLFESGESFICCVVLMNVKATNSDDQQTVEQFKSRFPTNYIWVEARSKTIKSHFGRLKESNQMFEIIDLTSSKDNSQQIFAEAPIDDIMLLLSFQDHPNVNIHYKDNVFTTKPKGKTKKLALTQDYENFFQARYSINTNPIIDDNQPCNSGLQQSQYQFESACQASSQSHDLQSPGTQSSTTQSSNTQSSTPSSVSESQQMQQSEKQSEKSSVEKERSNVERQPDNKESLEEPEKNEIYVEKKWVRVNTNGTIFKFPILTSENFNTDDIIFPDEQKDRRSNWKKIMWNYTTIFDLIQHEEDLSSFFFMSHKEAISDKRMLARIDSHYRTLLEKSPPSNWSLVLFTKKDNHFTGKLV